MIYHKATISDYTDMSRNSTMKELRDIWKLQKVFFTKKTK